MHLVGIDPDLFKSGFAVWDKTNSELVEYGKLTFWELVEFIENHRKDYKYILEAGWLNKKSNWHLNELGTRSEKIAYRVGQNHTIGILIEELFKKLGVDYQLIKPRKSKLKKEEFVKITGITARINQDIRDAIMLVYGF